ncbi:hypothetical protein GCM10007877_33010 [Marinibactrum halimedae]|uniref:RHS repeat-associated core domain-containing protein n=1 Tax=Marinibactrum halimedae TaxID=1444977 RepID=A0AA37TEK3_9GAMM|nr:hypothetical protein GCM10007877_33010 [Marinibactrum halimedae]
MNLYAYVGNDPVNMVDPTGEFAWLAGMAIGGVLDVAAQGVAIAAGAQDGFSVQSVVASGIAGAVGAGMAANVAKLGLGVKTAIAANVATDATASATGTLLSGKEVTLKGVAIDVALGQSVGKVAGDAAASATNKSSGQKVLTKEASRKTRIANKPGARKAQVQNAANARAAAADLPGETSASAGVAGSTIGSKAVSTAECTSQGEC